MNSAEKHVLSDKNMNLWNGHCWFCGSRYFSSEFCPRLMGPQ